MRATDEQLKRRLDVVGARIPGIPYVTSVEPRGSIVFGPQVEAVLGHLPEAFEDDRGLWERIVHPDDLPAVRDAIDRATRTRVRRVNEYRVRATDGSYRWFRDEAVVDAGPTATSGSDSWST